MPHSPSPLEQASLASELRARFRSALASGALEPIPTELHEVEDGGVRFGVRVVAEAWRPPRKSPRPAADPFLPYEPALHVADVPPAHVCLLNKFPVLPEHALIVTRAFEEQTAPLEADDFEALWSALGELGGLGFYNAGREAGASQRHRHFQIVPTPLVRGPRATPIDALLDDARFDAPLGRAEGFPFLHAVARLRSCQRQVPAEAARALLGLYREMARAFGCDRPGRPYNLLVTRDWLLFVPRSRETAEGISLNALAFAGAVFVRDAAQLARVREAGPMSLLRRAGVAAAQGD